MATREQLKNKAGVVKRFVVLHVLSVIQEIQTRFLIPITRRYRKELALYHTELTETNGNSNLSLPRLALMEKEEKSRRILGMRCEKTRPFLAHLAQVHVLFSFSFYMAGEFSGREREYGS